MVPKRVLPLLLQHPHPQVSGHWSALTRFRGSRERFTRGIHGWGWYPKPCQQSPARVGRRCSTVTAVSGPETNRKRVRSWRWSVEPERRESPLGLPVSHPGRSAIITSNIIAYSSAGGSVIPSPTSASASDNPCTENLGVPFSSTDSSCSSGGVHLPRILTPVGFHHRCTTAVNINL